MARENTVRAEGVIVEMLPRGLCRLELANGHRLLGFTAGQRRPPPDLALGTVVELELSPFNLSRGRMMAKKDLKAL